MDEKGRIQEIDIREDALNDPPWFIYSSSGTWSIDFVREWKHKINWFYYCNGHAKQMTEDFVIEFADYVNWSQLSEWMWNDIIYEKFWDKIDWTVFTCGHVNELSEDFISKFAPFINWIYVGMSDRKWSNNFLIKNKKFMEWKYYFVDHKRKEGFINKVADTFDPFVWDVVLKTQNLSEGFKKKWGKL